MVQVSRYLQFSLYLTQKKLQPIMVYPSEIAQARPVLHTSLMQRMTDVLSRMLNDPATRAALSGGGEDSLEGVTEQQENIQNTENNIEPERSNDSVESSAEQSNIQMSGNKMG